MKPGNVNESLIFYLKAETNRLLKYDIWGDLLVITEVRIKATYPTYT